MLKFGRNYRMKIKIGHTEETRIVYDEEFEIRYPLTVNFQISRAQYANFNSGYFELFNLDETTRAKLYKDRYSFSKVVRIEFYAGYGEDLQNLPLCYSGEVYECFSSKTGGDPNIKTQINCITGIFSHELCFSNRVFAKGTKPLEIIQTLCNDAGMQLGNSDSDVIKSLSPLIEDRPFIGGSLDVLDDYVDGNMYIDSSMDNDKVWILGKNDVRPAGYYLTLNDTGMLGTLRRRETCLTVDMLFEPRLVESQAIELLSRTASEFNGLYKIVGFNHQGTISGAIGGQCRTSVLLYIGEGNLWNFASNNQENKS